MTNRFKGAIKPGEVRNPKGNPNPNIRNIRKTGPRTALGKLKTVLAQPNFRNFKESKALKGFRRCDVCPLGAKIKELAYKGEWVKVPIPARCSYYKKGGKCQIDHKDHVEELRSYFATGGDDIDTMMVHQNLAISLIKNAVTAEETEMMENRRIGWFTLEAKKAAGQMLNDVNRLKYGEVHKNLNVNMDAGDKFMAAFEKAREKEREEEENGR